MLKLEKIKTYAIAFLLLCTTLNGKEIEKKNKDDSTEKKSSVLVDVEPTLYIQSKGANQVYAQETGQIGTTSAATNIKTNNKKTLLTNSSDEMKNYIKVSLIDVVLEAVSNNYNIKVAREKVRQAKITLDDAYAGYKPTVDVEYKYGTTEKTPSDDGEDSKLNRYHDQTAKVKLRQNLYAGGATNNKIKGLEKSLEVAKNRYELAISKEIQNAIKAYFGVVFSYQSLYATRINMEMLEKILEIVTVKYDLGAATIGDMSSIKASVANAQSKLSKTNSKFVEALKYYEYIAGEDFKYTLPYEYELKIQMPTLEELLEKGNENNLNIVSYLTTIQSEQFKLRGAQSAFLPKVDLEVTHTRIYDKDIPKEEFYRQNTNEAYVTLKYNLYNADKDSNKILSIYSTIRETKYKIEEERRKLKWIVSNLHQSLNALDSSISSTKQEVESSQVTVEAYWEAFKNGEQDLQTLLTAQRQLNTAQVSLIEFYQSRLNDYFNLLFETGDLVEYFNLDPTKDNFIDFTQSKYTKNTKQIQNDEELIAFATVFGKKVNEEQEDENKTKELEVVDTLEEILHFKDKFLDANDDYYSIYIGKFDTIYDTFGYIKNNKLTNQAFMVDILEEYKLKNIMAYGIYETKQDAEKSLQKLLKQEQLEYKVLSIKTVKQWYKNYIDGFENLKPKELVETKTIKMAIKEPKPYFTNRDFRAKFISSLPDRYTINLVTFTKLDDAIKLVNKEKIESNSIIFRYGTNQEWIKVVYGAFDTYEEANIALNNLSQQTKQSYFPVIEFIKDKQDLYYKYRDLELGKPTFHIGKKEYEKVSEDIKIELREPKTSLNKKSKDKDLQELEDSKKEQL